MPSKVSHIATLGTNTSSGTSNARMPRIYNGSSPTSHPSSINLLLSTTKPLPFIELLSMAAQKYAHYWLRNIRLMSMWSLRMGRLPSWGLLRGIILKLSGIFWPWERIPRRLVLVGCYLSSMPSWVGFTRQPWPSTKGWRARISKTSWIMRS